MRRVEEYLYKHNAVIEAFSVTVGSGSMFNGGGVNPRLANIQVSLKEDRGLTSSEFVEVLRSEFSEIRDVKVTVTQPSNGPPTGSPIGIKLYGDDVETLNQVASQVTQKLSEISGVTNISTDSDANTTEIQFW